MLKREDIIYRDKVLRDYLLKRTWDKNEEFNFIREFILNYQIHPVYVEFLNPYKYFIDFEYDLGNFLNHKGDVILTDGRNRFLIVEFKIIWAGSSTKRTSKRKTLRKQIKDYMQFLNRDISDANIIGLGINDLKKPFYIEFLYYYNKIPNFFIDNKEVKFSKIKKLPIVALNEYCQDNGYNGPIYRFCDYNKGSFSDKYKGNISIFKDNEEYIEQKIGYKQERMKVELASKLCKKLKILYDNKYSRYYL